MSTSTISGTRPQPATHGPRSFPKRVSRGVWRALTPSDEGPVRGRTLEALRRVMETRLHARRLRERLPDLARHARSRERLWVALLPSYRRFVSRVAPPHAATSLEVAAFLVDLCERRRPVRVLEVGTGFASSVLRRLGDPPSWTPEIWSVDDDPSRLASTRSFLAEESLRYDRMLSWRELEAGAEAGFDLVVHELGSAPAAVLAGAIERVRAGGLLVLDGAQRPAAERAARRILCAAGAEYWSLRSQTRDCYGRHALLAQR